MSRTIRLIIGCVAMLVGLGLMVGWYSSRPGRGELTSMIYSKPSVMTVAYKAYGNPAAASGKYWLSKIVMENTGKGPLRDIKVSYQVPDYITWTSPDQVAELLPGQSAVFVWYPKFPGTVTKLRSKTPASLEIKFDYNDGKQAQSRIEKREFALRGVTEFEFTSLPASEIVSYYDYYDNQELCASYVTDEDPVVKTYYTKVSEVSGGINIITTQKDLVQLARSIYDFMVSTGMTYSGAKGVPEATGAGTHSMVQSMRLPRDVIYGNSGLCVELAYLWASLAQSAGAKPYLVFIPGHCFVILESGDGTKLPVECTMIGGAAGGNLDAAGTFEQAVESAGKTLDNVMQQGQPMTILDVQQYQGEGIRPPELEDVNRTELVKFLDDLRDRHARGNPQQQVAMNNNPNGNQPVPPPQNDPNVNPNPNPQPVPPPQPQPDPNVNPNPQPVPPPMPQPDPNPQPVPAPTPNPGPNPNPGPGPAPGPNPGPAPTPNGMTVWQDQSNRMSMPYPATWQLNQQGVQQLQQYMPGYVFSAFDPQTAAAVDVIFFDQLDMQKSAEAMLNFLTQMGANPQAGQGQVTEIAGHKAFSLPITLQGQQGPIQGALTIITINTGCVCVSVAAPGQSTQAAAPIFGQILSGIRFNG